MSVPQDLTQSPKKIIVDLILNSNPDSTFTEATFFHQAPIVNPPESPRNTDLVIATTEGDLTAENGARMTIHYNRLNLGAMINPYALQIENDGTMTKATLLSAINAAVLNAENQPRINLTDDDIDDLTVPTEGPCVITAKPTSIIWFGQASVDIIAVVPPPVTP